MYRQLRAPLSVQIEMTTQCDNSCVHCYNHWRHDRPVPHHTLSPAQATELVDLTADAGVFDLVITGGEPLLARDAVRALVVRARERGLAVSLNSTLRHLTPDDARWLRAQGLTSILTSVHGPQDVHDAVTHSPGSFAATATGIRVAHAAGLPVHANMVVSRLNVAQVVDTARLCQELGVVLFLATKAAQPENCAGFEPLRLSMDDISGYVRALREADLDMPFEVLSTFPLCGIEDHADLALYGRRCLAGVAMLTVGANGQVRPCNHTDLNYGSIWEHSLQTLWQRMNEWRSGSFLPSECRQCPALMLCGGGCRMEAKTCRGDLTALDPYARPNSLPNLLPVLRRREAAPTDPPRAFSINPARSRQEEFGTVLCAPGGAPILLSPEGARVWRQFSPDRVYFADEPGINWGSVDRGPYLAALARKRLISPR